VVQTVWRRTMSYLDKMSALVMSLLDMENDAETCLFMSQLLASVPPDELAVSPPLLAKCFNDTDVSNKPAVYRPLLETSIDDDDNEARRQQRGSTTAAAASNGTTNSTTSTLEPWRSNPMFIMVTVNGRAYKARICPESEVSLISSSFLDGVEICPMDEWVRASNGAEVHYVGEVKVSILVGAVLPITSEVLVSDNFYGIVLGIDWLEENECGMNYLKGEFRVKGERFPLLKVNGDPWEFRLAEKVAVDSPQCETESCPENILVDLSDCIDAEYCPTSTLVYNSDCMDACVPTGMLVDLSDCMGAESCPISTLVDTSDCMDVCVPTGILVDISDCTDVCVPNSSYYAVRLDEFLWTHEALAGESDARRVIEENALECAETHDTPSTKQSDARRDEHCPLIRRDATRRDAIKRDMTKREAKKREATRRSATKRDARRRNAARTSNARTSNVRTSIMRRSNTRPSNAERAMSNKQRAARKSNARTSNELIVAHARTTARAIDGQSLVDTGQVTDRMCPMGGGQPRVHDNASLTRPRCYLADNKFHRPRFKRFRVNSLSGRPYKCSQLSTDALGQTTTRPVRDKRVPQRFRD
jgi:hypothetical protein